MPSLCRSAAQHIPTSKLIIKHCFLWALSQPSSFSNQRIFFLSYVTLHSQIYFLYLLSFSPHNFTQSIGSFLHIIPAWYFSFILLILTHHFTVSLKLNLLAVVIPRRCRTQATLVLLFSFSPLYSLLQYEYNDICLSCSYMYNTYKINAQKNTSESLTCYRNLWDLACRCNQVKIKAVLKDSAFPQVGQVIYLYRLSRQLKDSLICV